MIKSVLLAVVLVPLLLLGWVLVQNAWRRRFRAQDKAGDVLAGRSDCGKCGCAQPCERHKLTRLEG